MALIAAPAHAGTITSEDGRWVFRAAPGEANEIRVERTAEGIRFTDAAATPTGCPGDRPTAVLCAPAAEIALYTGDGHDRVNARTPVRLFDGGLGDNTIDYAGYGKAVRVDLARDSGPDGAQLVNVFHARGSSRDDVLLGDETQNDLMGNGGNDRIMGRGGPDLLDGGYGRDTVIGGSGNDSIDAGHGKDRLDAGPGNDQLGLTGATDAIVRCGTGFDRISAYLLFGDAGVRRDCEQLTHQGTLLRLARDHLFLDWDTPDFRRPRTVRVTVGERVANLRRPNGARVPLHRPARLLIEPDDEQEPTRFRLLL
ncbi:hypothetical protein OJ998_28495 [Solirubrobacter taibaiensis]|nr:hypothetical protein [Solirubrobacter taibaiensis]